MKRFIQIVSFLILLLPVTAQEVQTDSIKRAKEREIKTTGLYLYGEAVHEKKSEAVKTAKLILTSEINKEIINRPNWQFAKQIEAKDIEYTTDQIDLIRGSKVRVIAYIKKDNLQAIFDKSAPSINLTDKSEKQEKEKEKEKDKKITKKLVTPGEQEQEATASNETPQKANDQQAESKPDTNNKEKAQSSISSSDIPDNDIDKKETTIVENPDISMLDNLLTVTDVKGASSLLTKYKRSGKLVYGRPETNLAPQQSYLMIYNKQGSIVAILDKGAESERTNLLTGEKATTQSFPSTSYIWFQLFD